jgi:hypothetical protein
MTNGAREALSNFLSDQIATRGQRSGTETTRRCRVRVPVSRLRIDGAAAGAKRPAPTQEKKRTPAHEKKRCMHCGKDFHVRGIFKHQSACKIEEASSSSSDSDEVKPPRVATKPGTSSGQSIGQAELLASLNEMLVKALQQSTVAVPTMVQPHDPLALAQDRERQLLDRLSTGSANAHELAKASQDILVRVVKEINRRSRSRSRSRRYRSPSRRYRSRSRSRRYCSRSRSRSRGRSRGRGRSRSRGRSGHRREYIRVHRSRSRSPRRGHR